MNADRRPPAELRDLLWSIEDGSIAVEGIQRIDELVRDDEKLLRQYIEYTRLVSDLRFGATNDRTNDMLARLFGVGEGLEPRDARRRESSSGIRDYEPLALLPPIVLDLPTTHYPPPNTHSSLGSWAFSYTVATVVVGAMILGAWALKVTHHYQFADAPEKAVPSIPRTEMVFVGRVTGMVDCKWSDLSTEPFAGAYVPLGRKYALASGLMEITYDSGAKVILQGTCTYEVESRAGGYLSLGKLTARVGERGERRGESAKPQAANPKSQIPNQQISNPQSLIPNPLFSVRTPTAIVTDLGTEFGVEVSKKGNTMSHVFRGLVKIEVVGDSIPSPSGRGVGGEGRAVQLRAGESARVEKTEGGGPPSITRCAAAEASGFVLEMPPPQIVLDSQTYAELVLSLKPVVYYRMERPRNGKDRYVIFDTAPGGCHGELRLGNEFGGDPYRPGRFGNSLWFRGPEVGDRMIVPDYPKAVNDRLTVAAWVVLGSATPPGWAIIAANWGHPQDGNDVTGQFHLGLYRRDGDLSIRVTQRDGQLAGVREGVSHPFPLGVWQHVVFVADGTTLHLYRNGKEVASGPCAGILPQPQVVSLGIGCKTNAAGTDVAPGCFYWQGRIDELAVFNQALPAETIRQLYFGKALQKPQAGTTSEKGDDPMNGP